MSQFNVGDIVTPNPQDANFVRTYVGESNDGNYTVMEVDGSLMRVRGTGKLENGRAVNDFRFKLVVLKRVEGMEIAPAEIQIGDEILVKRVGADKIVHTRQAVVGKIKENNDRYGRTLVFHSAGDHRSGKINWGQGFTETFTLIKAVPERDKLLDRLVGSLAGQVITYRETWARKHGDEAWDVVVMGRLSVLSTDHLRINISGAPVTFLKAED